MDTSQNNSSVVLNPVPRSKYRGLRTRVRETDLEGEVPVQVKFSLLSVLRDLLWFLFFRTRDIFRQCIVQRYLLLLLSKDSTDRDVVKFSIILYLLCEINEVDV